MRMYDVITIGSATRDVFLASDAFKVLKSKEFPTGAAECVSLGSKIELEELTLTTGGGATNAAATFGSLGLVTAVMTKIGDDSAGRDVTSDLKRFDAKTTYVRKVKNGQTAFSTLLTMKDGERTALVYRGVSAKFTPADINWNAIKKTNWIYLTSLGGNLTLSKRIIREAHKAGTSVAWNPGSGELKNDHKSLLAILPLVDVLIVNKEEAQMLTGANTIKQIFKMLHTDETIRIVTDSTKGAYACYNGMIAHAGTTGVKALSRTGAGDAFGSGFIAGLIKTSDIGDALQIGTLNAESVITKHGAKNGLLARWPSSKKQATIKLKQI